MCFAALAAGALIWNRTIIDYVLQVDPKPYPSDYSNSSIISRTSPAVSGDTMVCTSSKCHTLAYAQQTGATMMTS